MWCCKGGGTFIYVVWRWVFRLIFSVFRNVLLWHYSNLECIFSNISISRCFIWPSPITRNSRLWKVSMGACLHLSADNSDEDCDAVLCDILKCASSSWSSRTDVQFAHGAVQILAVINFRVSERKMLRARCVTLRSAPASRPHDTR